MPPRWFLWPFFAQTALAGGLCFVPLFDLLGYEFSLATGALAAVTGALIGLGAGQRALPELVLRDWLRAMGLAVAHLLGGLALIGLNALRVRNCDFAEGFLFFLHLPVATAIYAATVGFAVARLLPGRRWLRAAALVGLGLAPLVGHAWRLFWQPPIFLYDHLWGYFAGSLYDEAIGVTNELSLLRSVTTLRIAALLLALRLWERRAFVRRAFVIAGFAVVVALVAAEPWISSALGYRVTRDEIEQALSVTVERPGLVIHLPAGTGDKDQRAVGDDHAFRLAQLRHRLALPGVPEPPIHAYVYSGRAQKAQLMGAAATQIARPWLREIHINELKTTHPVVAHELVHVLAAEFGGPVLGLSGAGLSINMGLIEGLAEALTLRSGSLDLHSYAKAMRDLEMAPDVRGLMSPSGFWSQAPRRAYTMAGSFVRHLIDSRGIEKVKQLYLSGDFEQVYGAPLADLVSEWEAKIDALEVLPRDRREAEERFRRTSIFERPCAHVIAQLRVAAKRAKPPQAVAIRQEICRHLGNAPTERLALAEARLAAGDVDGFLAETAALLAEPGLSHFQRVTIYEERGNLSWEAGELEAAREMFSAALEVRESLASERTNWVRLWALNQPAARDTVRRLLSGDLDRALAAVELERLAAELTAESPAEDGPTLRYLAGRQLQAKKMWERSLPMLEAGAGHPFAPIEAERVRLIADQHWQQRAWAEARAAYADYARLAPVSGERAQAQDWIERLEWYAAGSPASY